MSGTLESWMGRAWRGADTSRVHPSCGRQLVPRRPVLNMVSMENIDPSTGHVCVQKRRRRYEEPGQPRGLTFSCYRGYAFLSKDRTRRWLCETLDIARRQFGFEVWAYVIMMNHS